MWMPKELRSNRPTPLNKGKVKNVLFPESEEEIEPEDALNLMYDYFDKKFEGMQAQINKNMEPPAKKFKKPDGLDIKGKGNKDQFDFNTEISFAIQECQDQISRDNIEDLSANLTSIATKPKKRNKLIKLADHHQWDGLLCRNMNKTPWQVILTLQKKLDKQNKE